VESQAVDTLVELAYIGASILFIYGIKMLGSAETARNGNRISALGMLVAVVATLLSGGLQFQYILIGVVIGSLIGGIAAARPILLPPCPRFRIR